MNRNLEKTCFQRGFRASFWNFGVCVVLPIWYQNQGDKKLKLKLDFFQITCRVCLQSITLCNYLPIFFFPRRDFCGILVNLEQKIFYGPSASNINQLVVAIKENFSGRFFFQTRRSEVEFRHEKLINVVTCLFAYHSNRN